nr:TauD/TfdA family dioxygenase [Aliamphritea spongicola]
MQIDLHSDGLSIQFEAEQARHYLNYYWLRDNCPESFDPQTRERVFDISELPQAPKARSAVFSTTDEPQLVIHWQHEDHISHYDLAWLQARCTAGKRPDPAAIPRKLWYGDHYQHFQRFHFHALKDAPAEQLRWAKSLLEEGVAIIDQMPDSDAGLTTLANLLGCIRPSVAGDYFEVKVHAVPVNLSYTAAALEMHTDTPAEEMAPGIQFLHCRVNTATGGESLFLDGVAAATTFREQYPEDFRLLSEKRIPFITTTKISTGAPISGLSNWMTTAKSPASPSPSIWPTPLICPRKSSTITIQPSYASLNFLKIPVFSLHFASTQGSASSLIITASCMAEPAMIRAVVTGTCAAATSTGASYAAATEPCSGNQRAVKPTSWQGRTLQLQR